MDHVAHVLRTALKVFARALVPERVLAVGTSTCSSPSLAAHTTDGTAESAARTCICTTAMHKAAASMRFAEHAIVVEGAVCRAQASCTMRSFV